MFILMGALVPLFVCGSYQCGTHCDPPMDCGPTSPDSPYNWIKDTSLESEVIDNRIPVIPDRVTVDLSLPPAKRWVEVGKQYADKADLIIEYFDDMLPHPVVLAIDKIASHLVGYKGFGDFGEEMKGYAEGLGIDLGYVVAANLVYQLESVGNTCDSWNNTGPTGMCDDDDWSPSMKKESNDADIVWYESEHYKRTNTGKVKTGICTSVVSNEASNSKIIHGRNLDWNLEESLRALILTVDFVRGEEYLYTASSIISFVGILNAMKPGDDGFSFSMDARCQGGKLWANLMESLAKGAMTPCQHSRVVMENSNNFDEALANFGSGDLIDDGYFIVGGARPFDGAVVTRGRNRVIDVWNMDETDEKKGWYRLETNYDHWSGVPSADDRRTPGYKNMESVGAENMDEDSMLAIMKSWPTYNEHTDLTCVMNAIENYYDCMWWSDNK